MRFEGLDLNLLVVLDALFECRSVTGTGERLNLSQPTISAGLGRLRRYFDDDLLIYVGGEMMPTAKGEELAPAVAELLNVARFRIIQRDEFRAATSCRRFRLIASDYALDVLLAGALAQASRAAPHVTFEVGPTGPQGTRQFQKGDVDLMITVPHYLMEEHPFERLFADESAVICWNKGNYAKGVDREDFVQADFAIAVFGEERRPTVSDVHFRDIGLSLKATLEVPSFSALPGAVCGTDRIAVLHSRHAEFFQRAYPIAIHRLPVPGPMVEEIVQWHRLRRNDAGIQWLLGLLREAADGIQDCSL